LVMVVLLSVLTSMALKSAAALTLSPRKPAPARPTIPRPSLIPAKAREIRPPAASASPATAASCLEALFSARIRMFSTSVRTLSATATPSAPPDPLPPVSSPGIHPRRRRRGRNTRVSAWASPPPRNSPPDGAPNSRTHSSTATVPPGRGPPSDPPVERRAAGSAFFFRVVGWAGQRGNRHKELVPVPAGQFAQVRGVHRPDRAVHVVQGPGGDAPKQGLTDQRPVIHLQIDAGAGRALVGLDRRALFPTAQIGRLDRVLLVGPQRPDLGAIVAA